MTGTDSDFAFVSSGASSTPSRSESPALTSVCFWGVDCRHSFGKANVSHAPTRQYSSVSNGGGFAVNAVASLWYQRPVTRDWLPNDTGPGR